MSNYALNEEINHSNSEKGKSIKQLIRIYRDLQFVEGDHLTFTH